MNIWLSENFYSNRKTIRLLRDLGGDAVVSLQKLWFYARRYAVDNLLDDDQIGILKDFDELDIELIAEWKKEEGVFFNAIKELKLIEKRKGQYFVHDFLDNNPQVSVLIKQKINGSKYAKKRWENKKIGDPIGDPLSTPEGDPMQREEKRREEKRREEEKINKKEKRERLIDDVLNEWKDISGQSKLSIKTKAYRTQINGRIEELSSERSIKEHDDVLGAFKYIFTNKRKQAYDDDYRRFSVHDWNITTLTRPSKFSTYLDEPPYVKQPTQSKKPETEPDEEAIKKRRKREARIQSLPAYIEVDGKQLTAETFDNMMVTAKGDRRKYLLKCLNEAVEERKKIMESSKSKSEVIGGIGDIMKGMGLT